LFRTRIATAFRTTLQDTEQIFLAEMLPIINEGLPTAELFGTEQAAAMLEIMSDADELMYSEGIVYKV
jgi:DNA replication licensing factor MCM3